MMATYHVIWDGGEFASSSALCASKVAHAQKRQAPRLWVVTRSPAEDGPPEFREVAIRRSAAATAEALVAKAKAMVRIEEET